MRKKKKSIWLIIVGKNAKMVITKYERRLTMSAKRIIDKIYYDDDDEDFSDFNDFLEELERDEPLKTLDELLEEQNLTYEEALEGLNRAEHLFEEMIMRISAPNKHKLTVCDYFCNYLEKNIHDNKDYVFWRMCFSDKSCIFFEGSDYESEEDRIRCFLFLVDDVNMLNYLYVNHSSGREKFEELISNITYSPDPVGTISLTDVKKIVRKLKFSGDHLSDNLEYLTSRINHSAELSQIAPVVFYSAFTRYKKRMMTDPNLDINFENAFNHISFVINTDNGKNISNFYEHLNIYISFENAFCSSTEDIYLNVEGFNHMSNICECELIDWSKYKYFRPLEQELKDDSFTCFLNGLGDNPCYDSYDIAFDDVIGFEDYHDKATTGSEILMKINEYIDNHEEICTQYKNMVINSNTDEYISLVNEVLNHAGINQTKFTAEVYGLVHTMIMDEIMNHLDQIIKNRLLSFINSFDEFAFSEDMEED